MISGSGQTAHRSVACEFGNRAGGLSGETEIQALAGSTGTFYGQKMTVGGIYTIAGWSPGPGIGDGGPANDAQIGYWDPVAIGAAGSLLLADGATGRIRSVAG